MTSGGGISAISEKTATYALVLGDAGGYLRMTTSSTTIELCQSVLVPLNASVAFEIGTQIDVVRSGVGEVRIAGEGGVTLNCYVSPIWLLTRYSGATLTYLGTDTWDLIGHVKTGTF
jgi:hypothetical protein